MAKEASYLDLQANVQNVTEQQLLQKFWELLAAKGVDLDQVMYARYDRTKNFLDLQFSESAARIMEPMLTKMGMQKLDETGQGNNTFTLTQEGGIAEIVRQFDIAIKFSQSPPRAGGLHVTVASEVPVQGRRIAG